jgi:hypothetical protein
VVAPEEVEQRVEHQDPARPERGAGEELPRHAGNRDHAEGGSEECPPELDDRHGADPERRSERLQPVVQQRQRVAARIAAGRVVVVEEREVPVPREELAELPVHGGVVVERVVAGEEEMHRVHGGHAAEAESGGRYSSSRLDGTAHPCGCSHAFWGYRPPRPAKEARKPADIVWIVAEGNDVIEKPAASETRSETAWNGAARLIRELIRSRRVGPTAMVAVAALAGLTAWLVLESRGRSSPETASPPRPVALSAAGLRTLAAALGRPLYWVGERKGTRYELTETGRGSYLRYLPRGVEAGERRALLTVATYPMQNAFGVTKGTAQNRGTVALNVPGDGIAVYNRARPTSIYLAFPGSDYQVEVYDPVAVTARRLASSGRVAPIVPIAASQGRGPVAASREELRALAASLGHPVYWAGPRTKVTYELTQTADGRTYVRYLPEGAPVGSKRPFLTVATYPMENAFAVTRRGASGENAVAVKVPKGGIAVYTKPFATNVYLAYPAAAVQVEVYDPSPTVPARLAADGRIVPVG